MRQLLFGLLAIFVASCAPRVSTKLTKTYPALDSRQEVTVLGLKEDVPPNATVLGTVRVSDSGFSVDCGWDAVIEKAKIAARKAGGNMIKITDHTPPNVLLSTCDMISAQILRVETTTPPKAKQDGSTSE